MEPAGAVAPVGHAVHEDDDAPALELYVSIGHAKGAAAAHVPAGSAHVHDAPVADAVTAEAAVTVIAVSTDPLAERTSSDHPPRAAISAAIEGAYGGSPPPVRVIVIDTDCTFAGAPKATLSQGSDEHAHCAQQPPPTPAACHDVELLPSVAR